MYRLYCRVPNKINYVTNKKEIKAIDYIIKEMTIYISLEGFKIIKDEVNLKNPIKFTQELLNLKSEIDIVI